MCGSLGSDQAIKIKGISSQLQVEAHGECMCEYFADQAMLKVPEVVDTDTIDGKALCEVSVDGFDQLAPARASME